MCPEDAQVELCIERVSAPALKSSYPHTSALMKRRKLKLKAEVESSISHFSFNTHRSRRFQRGFDRVNLHRPTMDRASAREITREGGH